MLRRLALLILVALPFAVSVASASEPRPWLCRDKPAISLEKGARFDASGTGTRRWRVFFMQFEAGGPHDGFSVALSRDVVPGRPHTEGEVGPGRFFTVALYLSAGGHWVCPGSVEENGGKLDSGVLRSVTYSDGRSGSCSVTLTAKVP